MRSLPHGLPAPEQPRKALLLPLPSRAEARREGSSCVREVDELELQGGRVYLHLGPDATSHRSAGVGSRPADGGSRHDLDQGQDDQAIEEGKLPPPATGVSARRRSRTGQPPASQGVCDLPADQLNPEQDHAGPIRVTAPVWPPLAGLEPATYGLEVRQRASA